MSTLYTVDMIVIVLLFIWSFIELRSEGNFAESQGKAYFMRRNTCIKFIVIGLAIAIFSIIAVIAATNLEKTATAHWITTGVGGIYALFGIVSLIRWKKIVARKRALKAEENV